ncbi:MAG: hypothetical protein ACO1SX_18645 [Actinomycetota bacterium]
MVGFLVALVAVLAQWSRSGRAVEQRRSLNDGTTVTLLGVTAGRPHQITTGNPVAQIIAPLAPAALTRSTGFGRFTRPDVPPETPVAWIYTRAMAPLLPTQDFGGLQLWTIGDEDGCETQLIGPYTHESGGAWAVSSFELTTFPRHGKRIALRAYRWSATPKPTVELWAPNPASRSYPVWDEAPTPVHAVDGDVRYTLRRFVSGADHVSSAVPPRFNNRRDASTHLEIEATRGGRPVLDWMPVSFELQDATGNLIGAGNYANPRREGNLTHLSFYQNLFKGERTWRIRAEVARTPSGEFSAAETYTFRDLAAPARSTPALERMQPKDQRVAIVNGMRVEMTGVRWSSHGPPYAEIGLGFPGAKPRGWRVTPIRVVDDQGREAPSGRYEPTLLDLSHDQLPTVLVELPFEIRKPMKTVDVTIAVQKTRYVEFMASPTRPVGTLRPAGRVTR